MPVNLKKCCLMRVGGQHSEECNDPQIRYRGWILRVVDDEEDVRHLGFWATPNGDWKGIVDRVHAFTLETINIVKHSDKYRFFFQVIITDKAKARRGGGKVSVL